jgi:PAS domain S-box-containing protein
VNPAAERLFGYTRSELLGQNVNILMPSPHREAHQGYIDNYLRTGHARIIGIGREVQGRRKDGSLFPMDLAVSEVRLPDRVLFTGFIRDISERKELEEEILRISEVEQRRIGQDLHDGICQQLSGIELMSRALESRLARVNSSEEGQAARIAEHVREVLTETRLLSHGLTPLALENEDLGAALTELAARSEEMFGVRCRCPCPDGGLVPDIAARTQLYRIAQEAVNNAIRHGKASLIDIRLKEDESSAELSVRDDGSGIPRDAKPGKGMGLKIMNYRAQMIGGRLFIERGAKRGTIVRCLFPARASVAPHQKEAR